jgi:hypothetical protein
MLQIYIVKAVWMCSGNVTMLLWEKDIMDHLKHGQQLFVVDTGTLLCLPHLSSPPQEYHYAVLSVLLVTALQQNLQNCA